MANVIVPTRGDIANYDESVLLGGVPYSFRFRYNDRDNSWYLSIHDAAGEAIRSGVKLVPNFLLLQWLVAEGWNAGDLVLLDARPAPKPPLLADLGSRATLVNFAG